MRVEEWIKDLSRIREALERIWSKDTAHKPSLKTGIQTKSRGQCYVTALLLKDLMGADVVRAKVNGETHYWNRFSGYEFDLTSDQYGGDGYRPVIYDGRKITKRNVNLMNKRYRILKNAWDTNVSLQRE